MNIGELFVNLGIKGTEKTVGALSSVKKGLGEVSSMSLEAKAAILAALYGLERMTAVSGAVGTGLTNFTAITGMSAKSLQQWEYAARQAGVSGEEMAGSLKSVQGIMTNMLLGKGMPEGMGLLANKVGFDTSRARDTQYVMGQLQKFAQSVPPELATTVIKSFGLGEGVIAAMRRNAFRPEVFARAPTYSDNEIKNLDRANIAWSNLGNKIEMAFGHFNALHGGKLVNDISNLTDQVLKLADALTTLAEKLKIFTIIGKAFGFVAGEATLVSAAARLVGGEDKEKIRKELIHAGGVSAWLTNPFGGVKGFLKGTWVSPDAKNNPHLGNNQQIQINQNLNFQHDGKDHHKAAEVHKNAAKGAYRQMPAQKQGS